MAGDSLCIPFLDKAADILSHSAQWMWKPLKKKSDAFWKLPNASLYFCGFSLFLIPIIVTFWILLISILLAELLILVTLGSIFGFFFLLVGIWPSVIIVLCCTGISILRLPWNIYYHCMVTYRTVMLRRNIKLLSFILIPIVHLLIPPTTMVISIIVHVPWFSAISFAGFPTKPWEKIQPILTIVWKKFATDIEVFYQNYGHPSGIPMDWDGRVYGLPVDPIAIILSIFLYIFTVLPVTFGVFVIFTIKAIPIFLGVLKKSWKSYRISKFLNWYLELIEEYANLNIFKAYGNIIKTYARYVKKLDPQKLVKLTSSYMADFSPLKLAPSQLDCNILFLWLPILLTTIMWVIGLILVLTIPPGTFLLTLLAWIMCWILVFILPPVLYISKWILIIFGLPVFYILLWGLVFVSPWAFVAFGSLSGPFLALGVPFAILTINFYNPVEMWSSIKSGLGMLTKIFMSVDRFTATFSIGQFRLLRSVIEEEDFNGEERVDVKYWDLYIARCIKEARRIRNLRWISQDDIQAASSASMIAIPGVTIIAVLVDSIKKNKKDKTLIYWNEENKCRDSNRVFTDNVVNLFWPQLMKVKEGLLSVNEDLDSVCTWVSASLCDGEDERSQQLKGVLENQTLNANMHKKCLKIRSMVENIVHSLLRVKELTSRLHEIFEIGDEEEHLAGISDDSQPSDVLQVSTE